MALYKLVHKGSSFVAWDDYKTLVEAIQATEDNPKHRDKIVKIYEDRVFDGYKGYYCNGKEVSGERF